MNWYTYFAWILFAITLLGFCFHLMKHYVDTKFDECRKFMDTEYRWIRDDITALERDVNKIEDNLKK